MQNEYIHHYTTLLFGQQLADATPHIKVKQVHMTLEGLKMAQAILFNKYACKAMLHAHYCSLHFAWHFLPCFSCVSVELTRELQL